MAFIRGGSTKNVVLLVKQFDSATFEAGKTAEGKEYQGGSFLDAEIARFQDANGKQVNENQPPQKVPNLRYSPSQKVEGKMERGVAYNDTELGSLVAAAGENIEPLVDFNTGKEVGRMMLVEANVIPTKRGGESFLRIDHKSAKPISADIALPENIREAQFQGIQADRETIKSQQAAKAAEKDAGKEVETAGASKDSGPEFD